MSVGIESVTENNIVTASDGGRGSANLVYVLYIVGFFTGITALVGVILAYVNRDRSSGIYRSHLNFQIKIFWRGVIFMAAGAVLSIVVTVLAAVTWGIGAVLMVLPAALGVWWLVWTIIAIARGMGTLGRQEAI